MARPKVYTSELAAAICERLAAGESLKAICRTEGMPSESTVRLWVVDDHEGFAAPYWRARNVGLECVEEGMQEIADAPPPTMPLTGGVDTGAVQHARLRVDTLKWRLSKLAPKKYGERLAHEVSGPDGGPIEIDDVTRAARIEAIFAAAKRRRNSGEDLV